MLCVEAKFFMLLFQNWNFGKRFVFVCRILLNILRFWFFFKKGFSALNVVCQPCCFKYCLTTFCSIFRIQIFSSVKLNVMDLQQKHKVKVTDNIKYFICHLNMWNLFRKRPVCALISRMLCSANEFVNLVVRDNKDLNLFPVDLSGQNSWLYSRRTIYITLQNQFWTLSTWL